MMTPQEYAKNLRALADFCETHNLALGTTEFERYVKKDELLEVANKVRNYSKEMSSDLYFRITFKVGDFTVTLATERVNVCQRKFVGKRTVEKLVYPEQVIPQKVMVVEDVYEWECPSLLKKGETE